MSKYARYCVHDYSSLRGLIREKIGNERDFAKSIGRSHGFVSQVFNGKASFDSKDVDEATRVLNIEDKDIGRYFFAH